MKVRERRKPKLPGDPEKENDNRAEWALEAVACFMKRTHLTEADGFDTAVMDLIADLAHFCDRRGLEMKTLARQAHNHYDAETDGEGTQLDFAVDWN